MRGPSDRTAGAAGNREPGWPNPEAARRGRRAGLEDSGRVRAFVAVLLSDEVRAALAAEIRYLQSRAPDVAWVPPENLHLTLKFLGAVEEERVPLVGRALAAVAARMDAFDLAIAGLGAFPSVTRPRVLWAGISAGAEALACLAGEIEDALAALGFAREERPFAGHVTLGRVRVPRRDPVLGEALAAGLRRPFGRTVVDRLTLIRSDLSPRGARYTPLDSWPLGT
ncbi:MAG TPA: RNA 2',3'-cyclic phosphodiesterase [Candidatus Binatia bacterium]|nr:RNA 2',3'-cyclic phosphodiesterase [Candidatus Binatia bacterium]